MLVDGDDDVGMQRARMCSNSNGYWVPTGAYALTHSRVLVVRFPLSRQVIGAPLTKK